MKKRLFAALIVTAMILSCAGCTEEEVNNVVSDVASEAIQMMEEAKEDKTPAITIEDIIAANSSENIFANYEAVTLKEHDYTQDRDTENYYSRDICYITGPEYYALMSKELVATMDPEGLGYGCVVDEHSFEDVFASYMRIDWTNYEEANITFGDDNTFTMEDEYEDFIITYDPDSLLIVSKVIRNKDGSDWQRIEYEYSKENRDEDIIIDTQESVVQNSDGETVNLTIKTDGDEKEFLVPKGYSAIIYSEDYYYYEETGEEYFSQPLTEDTVLVNYADENVEAETAEDIEE